MQVVQTPSPTFVSLIPAGLGHENSKLRRRTSHWHAWSGRRAAAHTKPTRHHHSRNRRSCTWSGSNGFGLCLKARWSSFWRSHHCCQRIVWCSNGSCCGRRGICCWPRRRKRRHWGRRDGLRLLFRILPRENPTVAQTRGGATE